MFDLTDYHLRASATAIYDKALELHYLVPAVVDEVFELLDTPPKSESEDDEAGDVLWTTTMLRAAVGLPLAIKPPERGCHSRDFLELPARDLLHRWTKITRDRRAMPDTNDVALIDTATAKILSLLMVIADRHVDGIGGLVERNLAKLAGRQVRGTLAGSGAR